MLDIFSIFESFLGSLAVAVLAIPALAKVAVTISDRQLRRIHTVLGPYRKGNRVVIRTSVIEALRVEKQDGESHEVKGNLLDSYEIAGAFELKKFLEGPQWLAGVLESVSPSRDWSAVSGTKVTIEVPGLESSTKLSRPQETLKHSPMILIGSGVFNGAVRQLHDNPQIARIKTDGDETAPIETDRDETEPMERDHGESARKEAHRDEISEKKKEPFRRRKILLSDNQMPPYARKATHEVDGDGQTIYEEYALIQQVVVTRPNKRASSYVLVIAGLGSGGTGGAIQYCLENWDELETLGDENPDGFTIVLKWLTSDFSKRPDLADIETVDLSRTEKPKPVHLVKPV